MIHLYESISKNRVAAAEKIEELEQTNAAPLVVPEEDGGGKKENEALKIQSFRTPEPPDSLIEQVCAVLCKYIARV